MKILPSRPLYIQIIFTILAFTAMVSLSYLFLRSTVHSNLVRNAESVFSFAKTQLESDLLEPRMMLSGFSQTVRSMIIRGDSSQALENYIDDIAEYLRSSGSRILRSSVMYVYFESSGDRIIISSSHVISHNFLVFDMPWYEMTILNCDLITETAPYVSGLTGKTIITFARCIYDENGDLLGIVCMDINIEDIGTNIIEIALDQGGYGIILSQDLDIIAHVNPDFIGRHISNSDIPLYVFAQDLRAGNDIIERPLNNWKGEATVAFFRRLENGWYLGLLTPEVPFYKSLANMASTLIMLGTLFAAALVMILIRIDAARVKSDRESKRKSVFLANMSHEIRTPMNAIIGMTAIGKTSANIERKDHCFNKIEDAGNHLLGVINDILDMSKIEADRFDLSPAEFNFERTLQRIVNVVNFRIDEKQQKLAVHIDKNIPKLLIGDDQRLAQVITNLLGNSIKFTPEKGAINLDAEFIEEINGVCTIQVSVSDNGIGMTPEQQKRVFSSFEQAETATTRKYGGTGLGLTISKSIVELMGGKIWMVSEIDKGTTFTFIFKMIRGAAWQHELLSPDVNIRNVRIMAVDDDQDVLDYFREISSEFNIHCDTAISGDEAIRLVEEKGQYHIYFVDWKMPGMDGIQLTRELKAHHESVKSVVIMITAGEWTEAEKEARIAGVDKFLAKPLFPSCIANVINEALGIDRQKLEKTYTEADVSDLCEHCILLVEDIDINREIVISLLEPTNIKIDCAENGRQAVQMFKDDPDKYDIIFMDVQMPEMDGYEATRRIRALGIPQSDTIRIVAMTANVFREDIERCLEAGMDNHIGKPLDYDEILRKLSLYLPRKNRRLQGIADTE
ncbi:MAG: response regulator [Treponema sp.]|nr:response regulator [Treponema sp.]